MKYITKWTYNKKESYFFSGPKLGVQKNRTINKVLNPLIDVHEISHMHSIRTYENDSLSEIDRDQKGWGFKNLFKQKSKKADISCRIVS